MLNPFAAPRADSPPPAEIPASRRLLSALGIFEMVCGVALAVLFLYIVGEDVREAHAKGTLQLAPTLVAFVFLMGLCGLCVAAGYKLRRRSSWKPLLLQAAPVLMAILFALSAVLGW